MKITISKDTSAEKIIEAMKNCAAYLKNIYTRKVHEQMVITIIGNLDSLAKFEETKCRKEKVA